MELWHIWPVFSAWLGVHLRSVSRGILAVLVWLSSTCQARSIVCDAGLLAVFASGPHLPDSQRLTAAVKREQL
jgi:hypothetical protein